MVLIGSKQIPIVVGMARDLLELPFCPVKIWPETVVHGGCCYVKELYGACCPFVDSFIAAKDRWWEPLYPAIRVAGATDQSQRQKLRQESQIVVVVATPVWGPCPQGPIAGQGTQSVQWTAKRAIRSYTMPNCWVAWWSTSSLLLLKGTGVTAKASIPLVRVTPRQDWQTHWFRPDQGREAQLHHENILSLNTELLGMMTQTASCHAGPLHPPSSPSLSVAFTVAIQRPRQTIYCPDLAWVDTLSVKVLEDWAGVGGLCAWGPLSVVLSELTTPLATGSGCWGCWGYTAETIINRPWRKQPQRSGPAKQGEPPNWLIRAESQRWHCFYRQWGHLSACHQIRDTPEWHNSTTLGEGEGGGGGETLCWDCQEQITNN